MSHYELLIGGHMIGGPCDQSVAKGVSRSPFDGKTVGTWAEASWPEARAALDAAADGFARWRYSTREERSSLLRRIGHAIKQRKEELCELSTGEIGKPARLAAEEVDRTALVFELAARLCEDVRREAVDVTDDPRATDHRASFERFPVGIILAITPFYAPFHTAAHRIATSLASGNALVHIGSTKAALCTLALGRIILEAECPSGAVNVMVADAKTTLRMAEADQVDLIGFIGSSDEGMAIRRGNPNKRVLLEVGDHSAAIVFPDADLDVAAWKLSDSAFAFGGQTGLSARRIYVHQDVYPSFCDRFCTHGKKVFVGDPRLTETVCGPLIDDEAATRIERLVGQAVASGARRLIDGQRRANLVSPEILENVSFEVQQAFEGALGPVAMIESFRSVEEVVERINRSQVGTHVSAFTVSAEIVRSLYRDLEVGGLIVNESPNLRFDAMPYGGFKNCEAGQSGIKFAMEELSRKKSLVVKKTESH